MGGVTLIIDNNFCFIFRVLTKGMSMTSLRIFNIDCLFPSSSIYPFMFTCNRKLLPTTFSSSTITFTWRHISHNVLWETHQSHIVYNFCRKRNFFWILPVYIGVLCHIKVLIINTTLAHKNNVRSSLPLVVCRRTHVLFTLLVFVCP